MGFLLVLLWLTISGVNGAPYMYQLYECDEDGFMCREAVSVLGVAYNKLLVVLQTFFVLIPDAIRQLPTEYIAGGVFNFVLFYTLMIRFLLGTWRNAEVPGPSAITVFGNSLEISFSRGFIQCLQKWRKRYGKVFGIHLGIQPVLVVCDKKMVVEILGNRSGCFSERPIPAMRLFRSGVLHHTLFGLTGQERRQLRHLLTGVFHPNNLKYVIPRLNACAARLAGNTLDCTDYSNDPKLIDVEELMTSYIFDAFAALLLGLDIEHTDEERRAFFDTLVSTLTYFTPHHHGITVPSDVRKLVEFFRELYDDRRFRDSAGWDYMSLLLQYGSDSRVSRLSEDEIVGMLLLWVMHSYQTLLSALQFVIYFLACNPSLQDLCYYEIKSFIGKSDPDEAALASLQQLDGAIREALLLMPPVQQIWRTTGWNTVVGGVSIPAGASVLIPVSLVHLEEVGVTSPYDFHPDRHDSPRILNLSFGGGSHVCLGLWVTMVQMKTALVHLIRTVRIQAPRIFERYGSLVSTVFPPRIESGLEVTGDSILRPLRPLQIRAFPRRTQGGFSRQSSGLPDMGPLTQQILSKGGSGKECMCYDASDLDSRIFDPSRWDEIKSESTSSSGGSRVRFESKRSQGATSKRAGSSKKSISFKEPTASDSSGSEYDSRKQWPIGDDMARVGFGRHCPAHNRYGGRSGSGTPSLLWMPRREDDPSFYAMKLKKNNDNQSAAHPDFSEDFIITDEETGQPLTIVSRVRRYPSRNVVGPGSGRDFSAKDSFRKRRRRKSENRADCPIIFWDSKVNCSKPAWRQRAGMTACGNLTCQSGTVCMESHCLCEHSHLAPRLDGSCPQHTESEWALNHTGVLRPHLLKNIMSSFLNTSQHRADNLSVNNETGSSDNHSVSQEVPAEDIIGPLLLTFSVGAAALIIIGIVRLVRCLYERLLAANLRRREMRCDGNEMLLERMGTVTRSTLYHPTAPTEEETPGDPDGLQVINPTRLKLEVKIGDGAFGTVFKGWLAPEADSEESGQQQGSKLVAVKTQRDNSDKARKDFLAECRILASLHHRNILSFHGVVYADDPPGSLQLVTEFAVHGDLATVLRKNDPAMRGKDEHYLHLDCMDQLLICRQIASGMEYLSGAHFVHRDLAARNCLLAEHLVVKISDFGMSRDIYTSDDYRVEGTRLLPIRWMSPECIRYGRFTVQSDVWAFGVLLWEVYTFGRQPYFGLSNLEVMHEISNGKLLKRPKDCPEIIRVIMKGCWRSNPADRYTFTRICGLLSTVQEVDVKPKPYLHDDEDVLTSSLTSESDLLQE